MVVQCTGLDDRVPVKGRQEERNTGIEGSREERREEERDGETDEGGMEGGRDGEKAERGMEGEIVNRLLTHHWMEE